MKVAWGQWDGEGGDSFKNTNKCCCLDNESCGLYEVEFVGLLSRWLNRLEVN